MGACSSRILAPAPTWPEPGVPSFRVAASPAPLWGTGGREFKSPRSDQSNQILIALMSQWLRSTMSQSCLSLTFNEIGRIVACLAHVSAMSQLSHRLCLNRPGFITSAREVIARRPSRGAWIVTCETQVSLTDPDARAIATTSKQRSRGSSGYNVQTALETKHHLIVAYEVTNLGGKTTGGCAHYVGGLPK